MKKYKTKDGYIVAIEIDSVGRFYVAKTNDFEFYDEHLTDLDYKVKEEAQIDLDRIANKCDLEQI